VTAPTSIAARLAVSALAAILSSPDAAQGAEPAPRLELRGEASFPLQYGQSYTAASQQTAHTIAPFGGLMATAHLQNDWSTSVFASGGHDQLGRFRDNDDTFASLAAMSSSGGVRFSAASASSIPIFTTGRSARRPISPTM
jgi:hypothetical protein